MSTRLVNVDRNTPLLLPPDLREWVSEADLVHFVIEAVEGMKLRGLRVNERGTGSAQYPPTMMMELLVYCYANGVFSSRRIERATHRDIAVRMLTANTHPDHDTIAKFRRENRLAVSECFVKVLELAQAMGLLKVGTVSVDGTKMRANASKDRNVTYERSGELLEQLELEVAELLEQAEAADQSEVGQGEELPKQMEQARQQLERRARERAQREGAEYERKRREREEREGSRKGAEPKRPDPTPRANEQQNLTDGDSRLMRKNRRSSFEQSYNAQAVVDAQGTQRVLATRVSNAANDSNELAADIEQVPETVGRPNGVLADKGYANESEVQQLQQQGIDCYVSVGAESEQQRRRHDFRPRRERTPRPIKAPWMIQMRDKLRSEQGRALYRLRKQTVEPVFGTVKHAMGFRQFLLRGLERVNGEWELVLLAYNMRRMWSLAQARA
jgi:transposase